MPTISWWICDEEQSGKRYYILLDEVICVVVTNLQNLLIKQSCKTNPYTCTVNFSSSNSKWQSYCVRVIGSSRLFIFWWCPVGVTRDSFCYAYQHFFSHWNTFLPGLSYYDSVMKYSKWKTNNIKSTDKCKINKQTQLKAKTLNVLYCILIDAKYIIKAINRTITNQLQKCN